MQVVLALGEHAQLRRRDVIAEPLRVRLVADRILGAVEHLVRVRVRVRVRA